MAEFKTLPFFIGPFKFDLFVDDKFSRVIADADVEIITPVYGNPYLRNSNHLTAIHNINTLSLIGNMSSFEGLRDRIDKFELLGFGFSSDKNYMFKGIVISVSYQQNLLDKSTVVEGQIKYIDIYEEGK
jgi:hypothetical protein